jgi:Dyp-type peroxidase family
MGKQSAPPKHLLTVCIPMLGSGREGQLLAEETNRQLERLGNPLNDGSREGLDEDGCIHFMSIVAIAPTHPNEPTMLVIEASGDGSREEVIGAIVSGVGSSIFPIFARACGVKRLGELKLALRRHARVLKQRWPIGKRIFGLPFAAIDDFSVSEILGHAQVAEDAREAIAAGQTSRIFSLYQPLDVLEGVRKALKDSSSERFIKAREGMPSPSYVDRPDAIWIRKAINKLKRSNASNTITPILEIVTALPLAIWAAFIVLYALSLGVFYHSHSRDLGFVPSPISDFVSLLPGISLALLPAIVAAVLVVAGLLWMLRRLERQNGADDSDPDPDLVAAMLAQENPPNREGRGQWMQNHMTSITEMQGGFLRRKISLPFAFQLITKFVTSQRFRKGFLSDMGTIHFARWFLLPKTSKLIFFSNYDGSWESYFEDFIIKAADGVTSVWSNTLGFPKTRFLLGEGATDGDRFKRFARRSMIPTPFWYSAYPELSAEQIRKNGLIVHGLANIKSLSEAEAWLEMFGSMPRPEFAVETSEIQNLVFGANGHLDKSCVYALRFPANPQRADASAAQKWLAGLLPMLAFGDFQQEKFANYVALSSSGLAKLGLVDASWSDDRGALPDVPVHGLSPAFVQGMSHPARQRLLKDPPAKGWQWGSEQEEIDAVVLTYRAGSISGTKDTNTAAIEQLIKDYGLQIVDKIETEIVAYKGTNKTGQRFGQEPFGFVDGISQPKARGIHTKGSSAPSIHTIEAGELVLGYRDNLGFFPTTPTISVQEDAMSVLPSLPDKLPLRWPGFGEDERRDQQLRDFGRNGSYLVIRQLKQDVTAFEKYANDIAKQQSDPIKAQAFGKGTPPEKRDANWVKSRMMGRWQNGASLLSNPHTPKVAGSKRDLLEENEFLFGEDDPQGVQCPLGAHVRRANPRDSQNPRSENQLDVSNRHRLLRRGRTFTRGRGKAKETGTMFMCFNADIERQFEFIQQTWLNSESFHGLANERDPIAGPPGDAFDYSVPSASKANSFKGVSSFVELQGGGYFFLPSRRSLEFLCGGARR